VGWLERLGAAVVGVLVKVIAIVLLFMVVVATVRWARAHPADWQALVDKGMTTGVAVLSWTFDQIGSLFSGS